jgi:predicted metalloendopeptidase
MKGVNTIRAFSFFALPTTVGIALLLAEPPLKSGIDPKVLDTNCKPCDDFWRFANGAWMDANPIPPSQSSWGPMGAMNDQNRERLKVLLDQVVAAKAAKGSNDQKLGDLYQACMDEERAEKLGFQPIAGDLASIDKIASTAELFRFLEKRAVEQPIGPFAVGASPNVKNTEETIAGVGPSGLSLPERDFYFRDDARTVKVREEFLGHAARLLALAGQSGDTNAHAKTILEFEKSLAQPMLTNVARRDPYATFHEIGLAGLAEVTPSIQWKQIMSGLKIAEGTKVNVREPEYMKALEKSFASTPLDTWKLWLRWKTISGAAQSLNQAAFAESFRFNSTVLTGVKEPQPRWKRCVN